jgi:hypothetical protein
MKNSTNLASVLVLASLAAGATGAKASLINDGDSLTISGTIAAQDQTAGDIGYVRYGGNTVNCFAGAFALTVVNNSQGGNTFTIGSFCTDVGVDWKNKDNYTAQNFNGATGISPLWSQDPQSIENAAWLYNTYFVGQSTTAAQDAGIQLAIWKVLYDTSASGTIAYNTLGTLFSTGSLNAWGFSASAMLDAENDVAALDAARNGGTFTTYLDTLLKPNDNNSQELLYSPSTAGNNTAPVPEPTTILSGVMLALPLGVSAFRILRKKRNAGNMV